MNKIQRILFFLTSGGIITTALYPNIIKDIYILSGILITYTFIFTYLISKGAKK